jgi:hypothetical protein
MTQGKVKRDKSRGIFEWNTDERKTKEGERVVAPPVPLAPAERVAVASGERRQHLASCGGTKGSMLSLLFAASSAAWKVFLSAGHDPHSTK